MPAQILLTHEQLQVMADLGHNVIVVELPAAGSNDSGKPIDCWVLDEESMSSSTHRSVVIDGEGEVIGDDQLKD